MHNSYVTLDNLVIWGATDKLLIDQLYHSSWVEDPTRKEYMKNVSKRCRLYNKSKIRYDNPENFINDLISNGFLVKINYN